jgi:hypothetical protein
MGGGNSIHGIPGFCAASVCPPHLEGRHADHHQGGAWATGMPAINESLKRDGSIAASLARGSGMKQIIVLPVIEKNALLKPCSPGTCEHYIARHSNPLLEAELTGWSHAGNRPALQSFCLLSFNPG